MARLRIVAAGPGATIQDAGRFGFQRFGVTPAGPMDFSAYAAVAAMLGGGPRDAAIEIALGGLSVAAEGGALTLAYAGGAFDWRRGGETPPAAARLTLREGEVLSARPGASGAWSYLGVAGGFDVPLALGSRATHLRSSLGGLDGRMLRAGDALEVLEDQPALDEAELAAPFLAPGSRAPIRVLPGPQDDYFSPAALETFFSGVYELTPRADRMAYAFRGPAIEHARGFNIVSDGLAQGAVQIAGDGQPLVLTADRQPTGGYPKLGHVIFADLGRLAQLRPGETARFARATLEEALAARRTLLEEIAAAPSFLRPLTRKATTARLLGVNLIDGVVDALE
ncbi:biotin-dependent carboxyltransferase family protein [Methylocella sp.]|uniref:5-oxoprolinase subunit C family protein n=1 Tax=Methylocella sp. TaxID=1978226 RepID=UPI0035AE8345